MGTHEPVDLHSDPATCGSAAWGSSAQTPAPRNATSRHPTLRADLAIAMAAALLAGCASRGFPFRSPVTATLPASTAIIASTPESEVTIVPVVPATATDTATSEPLASDTPIPTPTEAPTAPATPTVLSTSLATPGGAQPLTSTQHYLPLTGDLSASSTVTLEQLMVHFPADRFQRPPVQQKTDTAITSQNPFLNLFPELSTLPAPAWVKEGARVTYHMASATINLQAPAKGPQEALPTATPQAFIHKAGVARIAQQPGQDGSAAEGYIQYDLVAKDDSSVVSSMCLFSRFNETVLVPSLVLRTVDLPGVGDYWINPAVLKNADRVAGNGLVVVRMPYKIGLKTYNTTRFQYKMTGAEYNWQYDNVTGLLLLYSSSIDNNKTNSQTLSQLTFVQQRQLTLPWHVTAYSTIPVWATEDKQMTYQGTYGLSLADGTTLQPIAMRLVARITNANLRWTDIQVQSTLQGQQPSTTLRATGVYQPFNGYWLPAEALRSLRNGQVVDRDPITGVKITAARGQGTVSLTETGASFTSQLTYDAQTGMLIGIKQVMNNAAITTDVELRRTGQ